MSASKEDSLDINQERIHSISKLGILAGGGEIPRSVIAECQDKGIEVFVIAFEGQTEPETVEGQLHIWTRLGAAGKILGTLEKHGVQDLVMIGRIQRPSFSEIRPDIKGAKILAKLGISSLGDDQLLRSLRKVLESEGFHIHGAHVFAESLLGANGQQGKTKPRKGDWNDIRRGAEILSHMGAMDVGQSIIVQQGVVLGVEAAEGTDALIQRCADYKRKGRGGVLVKMAKPGQDHDMDLPTIGPQTIENAASSGLVGIVYQAGATLLLNKEELARLADQHHIFICGIDPQELLKEQP